MNKHTRPSLGSFLPKMDYINLICWYTALYQNGYIITEGITKRNKHKHGKETHFYITNFESFLHELSPKVLKICAILQSIHNTHSLPLTKDRTISRNKYSRSCILLSKLSQAEQWSFPTHFSFVWPYAIFRQGAPVEGSSAYLLGCLYLKCTQNVLTAL